MDSTSPSMSPSAPKAASESRRNSFNSTTEEETIPPLDSIKPMIFAPIEKSLLEPSDIPRDKTARLELAAKRIDQYADTMDQNIWHSFQRERDRVFQHLRIANAQNDERRLQPSGIQAVEVGMMVDNLRAPAVPGKDYSETRDTPQGPSSMVWAERDKEQAVEAFCRIVQHGALPNFALVEEHRQKMKEEFSQAIEREKAVEARIAKPA